MRAIALVETGRPAPSGAVHPWPWTINVGGIGHFYETKAEAIAAAQAFQAQGIKSIDVGCMQINLMYHPQAFASLDDAFDPQHNAAYSARFLGALYRATGNWPAAAAAYHSQTPDIGADYERRVLALWPEGGPVALASLASSASMPLTQRLRMQHGRVAVMLDGLAPVKVMSLDQILGRTPDTTAPRTPPGFTPAPVPNS
jgi:hypothetical protein